MRRLKNSVCATLAIIACIVCVGCGVAYRGVTRAAGDIADSSLWHVGRHGELTEQENEWVATAWRYFDNNYNYETGFVNSTDRYPVVSVWHIADFIAALYCARELGLIESKDFDERFTKLLHQLNTMALAFEKLPNTLYNTKTGEMVNYANQPEEVGWSVIDIGRLLFWLSVIKADAPEFSEYVDRIILRYSFCEAVTESGQLFSAQKVNNSIETFEETGIGYTDYAQIGFRLWGLTTPPKRKWDPRNKVRIYDIELEYDSNWARNHGSYGPILSAPYLLAGIEVHWELPSSLGADNADGRYLRDAAERVYKVQEARYTLEGISTARTDHQLNRPPFFLQDSIFGGGYPWSTLSDTGENYPNLSLVSTRAVFGLWALWKTPYTEHLMEVIRELYDPGRGWFEGRYEVTGDYERAITISTNAMVLEAMTHKKRGALFDMPERNSYVLNRLSDEFFHPSGCLPELEG